MTETRSVKTIVEPTDDRLLVQPDDAADQTPGGIFIPAQAKEKPAQGTVVAVGPGKLEGKDRVPMGYDPGDKVVFAKYAGTAIQVDDVDMIILRSNDVLAKLRTVEERIFS